VDLVALRVDPQGGLQLTNSPPDIDGQGIADALWAAGLRPRHEEPQALTFGELELDRAARVARRGGTDLALTAREFDLLWHMASHRRRVFSTGQLLEAVWGFEPALDTGRIKVHVRRIRQKLESDPSAPTYIRTVRGVGYRFDA
jgi:DNA-binding response OmpR family regulator